RRTVPRLGGAGRPAVTQCAAVRSLGGRGRCACHWRLAGLAARPFPPAHRRRRGAGGPPCRGGTGGGTEPEAFSFGIYTGVDRHGDRVVPRCGSTGQSSLVRAPGLQRVPAVTGTVQRTVAAGRCPAAGTPRGGRGGAACAHVLQ